MAETNEQQAKTFDPFEPFREVRDAYLEAMSKTMIDAVNSEAYAKATGAMLDWSLTAAEPFRDGMEKAVLHAMQQLSFPSRQEVSALAERFTNLELRVDDMDAKLDRIMSLLERDRQTIRTEQTASHERPAGEA